MIYFNLKWHCIMFTGIRTTLNAIKFSTTKRNVNGSGTTWKRKNNSSISTQQQQQQQLYLISCHGWHKKETMEWNRKDKRKQNNEKKEQNQKQDKANEQPHYFCNKWSKDELMKFLLIVLYQSALRIAKHFHLK